MAAVNGVATFSSLIIDAAGSYTLAASDGSLTGATSDSFTITPAAAAQLGFEQQPTTTPTGSPITPAVTVAVRDAFGNTVTTSFQGVTLALSNGTFSSGGSTVTVRAVNGIATFSGLVIDTAGSYTFKHRRRAAAGHLVGNPRRFAPRGAVGQSPESLWRGHGGN